MPLWMTIQIISPHCSGNIGNRPFRASVSRRCLNRLVWILSRRKKSFSIKKKIVNISNKIFSQKNSCFRSRWDSHPLSRIHQSPLWCHTSYTIPHRWSHRGKSLFLKIRLESTFVHIAWRFFKNFQNIMKSWFLRLLIVVTQTSFLTTWTPITNTFNTDCLEKIAFKPKKGCISKTLELSKIDQCLI